ncbi:DUF6966 domain-containing protein [Ornithinimicrobium sp. LYQ103]|uniref:DUF6966 domain-containing protein n=1 Tax=Ornithinimicrobium sp. LYQ103 TaxID=3378796 RepID=UPI00385256EC
MTLDRVAELVQQLADLLGRVGEGAAARGMQALATEARSATSEADRRTVVRKTLALYRGMGSLQDLVLQNSVGVRPEQAELDALRSALFDEARRQIR